MGKFFPFPGIMTKLFGGAIECHIPPSYMDISKLREVPDNQEVFADEHSDVSLIVEILQVPEDDDTPLPAIYHFHELAECNSAEDSATIMESSVYSGKIPYFHDSNYVEMRHTVFCRESSQYPSTVIRTRGIYLKF